jgi:cyclohexadienyl dehydratase
MSEPATAPARRRAALLALVLAALGAPSPAPGEPASDGRLRVGTSGDYAPFSSAGNSGYTGFDIAVARAYAEERGLAIEFVPFRWPDLVRDLQAGKFDVAMSGVTVQPKRSLAGRFSVPVVESGAVLLMRRPEPGGAEDGLERTDLRIGVNAGGYLERVARERFPRATLLVIERNDAVREALIAGTIDAAVTDSLEAPRWRQSAKDLELAQSAPFTRDRKAYLVNAERGALAADLDRWLLERERDGSLARLRREQLGAEAGSFATTPLAALIAAIDERLALMPLVGAAKRRAGLPLEVPEREALVLDAAVAATNEAAARAGAPALPEPRVRAVFAAQLEAAKQVQWSAVRDPSFVPEQPLPDLDTVLRPALLRIGERIGALLVALPADVGAAAIAAAARDGLRTPRLSPDSVAQISESLAKLDDARKATSVGEPGGRREGAARSEPQASEDQ